MRRLARREFLRTASTAVTCAAAATGAARADTATARRGAGCAPKPSDAVYTPRLDYPIRPKRTRRGDAHRRFLEAEGRPLETIRTRICKRRSTRTFHGAFAPFARSENAARAERR
jgi:hypothetical protein